MKHVATSVDAVDEWVEVKEIPRRWPWLTEAGARARMGRGTLPHVKVGRRVLVSVREMNRLMAELPGVTAAEALQNLVRRKKG